MNLKLKEMENKVSKLFVCLGSGIDYVRFFQQSGNAKLEQMTKRRGVEYHEVGSLKDASKLVRDFINYFDLGSGEWCGGRVINEMGEFVAHISYNGRIWDSEKYPSNEIIV